MSRTKSAVNRSRRQRGEKRLDGAQERLGFGGEDDADWTEGIALRYGGFYGPGTSLYPSGEQWEQVRRRKFPVIGDGGGIWSFVHIADAAEATAFIGRLAAGQVGVRMMTEIRGASNAKAKRELGWQPRHPSWRAGFGS